MEIRLRGFHYVRSMNSPAVKYMELVAELAMLLAQSVPALLIRLVDLSRSRSSGGHKPPLCWSLQDTLCCLRILRRSALFDGGGILRTLDDAIAHSCSSTARREADPVYIGRRAPGKRTVYGAATEDARSGWTASMQVRLRRRRYRVMCSLWIRNQVRINFRLPHIGSRVEVPLCRTFAAWRGTSETPSIRRNTALKIHAALFVHVCGYFTDLPPCRRHKKSSQYLRLSQDSDST